MWQTIETILQQSWHQLRDQAMSLLPNILAAMFILIVGGLLGWLAGRLADRLIRSSHWNDRAALWGIASSLESIGILSVVRLVANGVQWLVILITAFLALYSLNPVMASDLVLRFVLYLPHLVVAAAILVTGLLLSRFLARSVLIAAVNAELEWARFLSGVTRVAVAIVAVAIALEHLAIGRSTILVAFAILSGGTMLAMAIAVGLGSQDLVRRWLSGKLEPPHETHRKAIHHW